MTTNNHLSALKDVVSLNNNKIINPDAINQYGGITATSPVLVILAAGKGTRFGKDPKCIQPIHGTPLARHSIDSFRRFSPAPVAALVGYRYREVAGALGADNIYVHSDNPAGGTAFAAYEALAIPGLIEANSLLIITMGDRIVPSSIYRKLWRTHYAMDKEADLTFLSAEYEPPRNNGKGRVMRDHNNRVVGIIEDRDIAEEPDEITRQRLQNLTEGNCPLYVIRAATLARHLQDLTNDNAQGQYYITDLVSRISHEGGDIRTVITTVEDVEYDLLSSDVTRPKDLALLEGLMDYGYGFLSPQDIEIEEAAKTIVSERPKSQTAAIVRQLEELTSTITEEGLKFEADRPVAIGISGGRLRIAFMHPDMGRFFGPAWQIPIGAADASGSEQIVMLIQEAPDRQIHLYPIDPQFRECVNILPSDNEIMYPNEEISDLHSYEMFGMQMSENLLLSLGYFSEDELESRQQKGLPLPPSSRWVSNSMRRPFALIGNAIASLRTLRTGSLGVKVKKYLGPDNFRGLRLVSSGNIPQGGFSSSSAVTVAAKNAINSLYELSIPPDLLVHLASQAEYGTGVRAGSLDQATIQKGRTGKGTLISSNPKDNYQIIGTYPVPTERLRIIFPYSVERDRSAWKWSWGFYAASSNQERLTAGEVRKMTGKAAEIAAIIVRLPITTDFFKQIEDDLVEDGLLSVKNRQWIADILMKIPLLATQDDLREYIAANRDWYIEQLLEENRIDRLAAKQKTEALFESLLAGWRDPLLRRTNSDGDVVEEKGAPLRAMLAYLFAEVTKNFYLIHHPECWIEYVTYSQRGDRSIDIDPQSLPSRKELESSLEWEKNFEGPQLLAQWLERYGAKPFDYNRGLDDNSLSGDKPPDFRQLEGSNFFRGLALIDLAEAMLKRAFGADAVAIRVNAAGQGDFFQVHVDTKKAETDEVKEFIRNSFYKRFGLAKDADFVEVHPGGGALGMRLSHFDSLPQLINSLKNHLS
ncbi:MAG: NTP transferase domain-containing protein [Bacteroidota bacterium]